MPTPERPRRSSPLAQVGFVVAALVVFACGWLGIHTNDWRLMIAYAAVALGAAAIAGAFSRRR